MTREAPVYPTWIKPSRIRLFWLLSAAILAGAVIAAIFWFPGLALAALALPFIYIATVITTSSYRLSPRGDDLQSRIHQLVVEKVGAGARLLDIGCGSGELIVKFAKTQPGDYVGLDYWPGEWGQYGEAQAERNARLEGVANVEFVHGSASKLPFDDGTFSRIVSTLTFHEVKDIDDKTLSLREAIRVLKYDGRFAFVDLFDDPGAFGGRPRVLSAISDAGAHVESVLALSEILELKWPMNTAKVLKYAVVVSGTKEH